MKLLLIEDEQELANSIQSYLTGNNFVCELAMFTEMGGKITK